MSIRFKIKVGDKFVRKTKRRTDPNKLGFFYLSEVAETFSSGHIVAAALRQFRGARIENA